MKKIILGITTAIMMVVLCMAMTACSSVEGTYKFESMKMNQGGVTLELKAGESYMGMTINEDAVILTMNKDKTFTLKSELMMGSSAEQSGTWEQKDGKYILKLGDESANGEVEATLDGNKLVLKDEHSGMEAVLKK